MKASITATYVAALLCVSLALHAQDWPTWRYDAGRTANTPHGVAKDLAVSWVLELPAPAPAWPEDPRLQFDASPEPIVVGGRMFVASAANDSLIAVDIKAGAIIWRFFADAPIRFAPVAVGERVYFGADDGARR